MYAENVYIEYIRTCILYIVHYGGLSVLPYLFYYVYTYHAFNARRQCLSQYIRILYVKRAHFLVVSCNTLQRTKGGIFGTRD